MIQVWEGKRAYSVRFSNKVTLANKIVIAIAQVQTIAV